MHCECFAVVNDSTLPLLLAFAAAAAAADDDNFVTAAATFTLGLIYFVC